MASCFTCHLHQFFEASKLPNPVVDMGNKIPNFQMGQFFEGQYIFFGSSRAQFVFVVAFKNLMISKTGNSASISSNPSKRGRPEFCNVPVSVSSNISLNRMRLGFAGAKI